MRFFRYVLATILFVGIMLYPCRHQLGFGPRAVVHRAHIDGAPCLMKEQSSAFQYCLEGLFEESPVHVRVMYTSDGLHTITVNDDAIPKENWQRCELLHRYGKISLDHTLEAANLTHTLEFTLQPEDSLPKEPATFW